jgi:hypothetical protein
MRIASVVLMFIVGLFAGLFFDHAHWWGVGLGLLLNAMILWDLGKTEQRFKRLEYTQNVQNALLLKVKPRHDGDYLRVRMGKCEMVSHEGLGFMYRGMRVLVPADGIFGIDEEYDGTDRPDLILTMPRELVLHVKQHIDPEDILPYSPVGRVMEA